MLGTTIAHYKITAKLGQGGMGEVYRATDTKLDREVAIKVLPQSVAQDKERLARFEREAKMLAQLNHPNIAGVYGLEQSGDTQALILELVEGDDLSVRLKRGPLAVEEALEVCKQIAEALEAAHEKGIIHRDLKPGNIKLTEDGKVKVLDFGLAKALFEESDISSVSIADDSPTITDAFTKPGTILGTAAYMSPEQARGKHVDKRTDIWAFGCVLFECLAGNKAFQGDDVTETLAAILKGEPDSAKLPENTPPSVQLLLRKCFNKDRKRRLPDIAAARIDLEEELADPSSSFFRLSDQALQPADKSGSKMFLAVTITGLMAIAVCVVLFLKPAPEIPIRRIHMDLGLKGKLIGRQGTAARISPDGSMLAFRFQDEEEGGKSKLYLRKLDQLESYELKAAEGANQFCFSPDSQWIAFRKGYGGKTLEKVPIVGGKAIPLCEVKNSRGIDWGDDEWIVFAPDHKSGLFRIPSGGGEAEPLTELADGESTHRWPQVLPGSHAVIFTARASESEFDDANIVIQRIPNGKPKILRRGGYHARYLSTGHLVYMQQQKRYLSSHLISIR